MDEKVPNRCFLSIGNRWKRGTEAATDVHFRLIRSLRTFRTAMRTNGSERQRGPRTSRNNNVTDSVVLTIDPNLTFHFSDGRQAPI